MVRKEFCFSRFQKSQSRWSQNINGKRGQTGNEQNPWKIERYTRSVACDGVVGLISCDHSSPKDFRYRATPDFRFVPYSGSFTLSYDWS